VTSVYRSFTEQLALYRNRARNPYPVAPPGSSKHNYGLAWDMVGPRQQLENAGRVWQSWGGTWGGQADPIHFEV
jgi:LAS superfamily LD-carboxypeptidase LdcB